MNNVTFVSKLLPGNIKDKVQACPTQADKTAYFLDHIIKPAVTIGVGKTFDDLLAVMEDCEYDGVKKLAKIVRNTVEQEQSKTSTG